MMSKQVFRTIGYLPEFQKELKRLSKKYPTLKQDVEIFVRTQLKLYHKLIVDNGGIKQIGGLKVVSPRVYKAKRFACRSLRGSASKSGIRIIYAYFEENDAIEFIEIYYKGDKPNENRERILKYYG